MSTLQEIQKRAAAATPGPWSWRGNVDHQDPWLAARVPGLGMCEVLGHVPVQRTKDDRQLVTSLPDIEPEDHEYVTNAYLYDGYGEIRKDHRLCFNTDQRLVEARKLARFEVAPNATDRDDPKVYRADVNGIRHPDAEFIANSRQDVDDLLAIIATIRDRAESWYDDMKHGTDETCIAGSGCPCCHARDILSVLGDDRPAVRPVREIVTVQAAGDVL